MKTNVNVNENVNDECESRTKNEKEKKLKSCGVVCLSDKKENEKNCFLEKTPPLTTPPQFPQKFLKITTLDTFKEWWDWWETETDTELENFCQQHQIDDETKANIYERIVAYCERSEKDYDDYRKIYKQSLLNKKNGGNNG